MDFGFLVAHGYQILKGYINDCKNEDEAKLKILNGEYDDIIDEYETDELTVGYEIIELWEIK